MKISSIRFFSLFAAVMLWATTAGAQDMAALRHSMSQRLPVLDQLKTSGAVGENNQGYVEARTPGADTEKVVAAENADRRKVYAAIAAKAGATSEAVAQARARQIAATSAPGVWLQGEDGRWYRKE
ncbi:YdbL family protein [Synoicihabitans lomoniglobus]|uniref:DUF1318 domain-containing protein n=1 Tax=Synoicihabitans lomoniglobus TaxID=2909285 RepID=A0AAF0CLL7_9BACT|nr:YdbL family protein [Opitutaceae bacterium LMO-M01]WED63033.1 DUF1318 domain-containing protein [Opitutaceae bacterium LMO-M01]